MGSVGIGGWEGRLRWCVCVCVCVFLTAYLHLIYYILMPTFINSTVPVETKQHTDEARSFDQFS